MGGALRLAKVTEREHGDKTISMAAWYLPVPFFQMMKRMRKGSAIVESSADLAGDLRTIATELSERLRGMGYNVPDADAARQQCGPVCRECLVDGVLDVGNVLRGMAAKWGMKETIECVVAE